VGYNFVVDINGSIFFLLAVVEFQNREITENSDKSGPYSSSRSPKFKVIDLGVNRKPRHDFLLSVGWWSFSSGFSLYFSLVSFLTAFVLLGVAPPSLCVALQKLHSGQRSRRKRVHCTFHAKLGFGPRPPLPPVLVCIALRHL